MTTTPCITYLIDSEAAEYVRRSPRTLQRLRQEGTGPRYYRAGGRILYTAEDLDALGPGECANLNQRRREHVLMPGFELLDVRRWNGGGKTRAFATVRFGPVTISGVKLIEGGNGPFIAGPSTKDKHGTWRLGILRAEPRGGASAAFEAALADGQR